MNNCAIKGGKDESGRSLFEVTSGFGNMCPAIMNFGKHGVRKIKSLKGLKNASELLMGDLYEVVYG